MIIKKFKLSLTLFFIFQFSSLFDSDIKIKFGICEVDSECSICVEKFEFSFVTDFYNRRVVAIGYYK